MTNSKVLSFLLAVFISLGFCLFTTTEKASAGIPMGPLGCCLSACFCDGFRCAGPEEFCNDPNFVPGAVCQESPGPICETVDEQFGCCLINDGICEDGTALGTCNGLTWYEGASCSEIPGCPATPANAEVPTLSSWGLIALAVIIGAVAFLVFRKKRATA